MITSGTILNNTGRYWTKLDNIRLCLTILGNTWWQYLNVPINIEQYWTKLDNPWKYWTILDHIGQFWDILGVFDNIGYYYLTFRSLKMDIWKTYLWLELFCYFQLLIITCPVVLWSYGSINVFENSKYRLEKCHFGSNIYYKKLKCVSVIQKIFGEAISR